MERYTLWSKINVEELRYEIGSWCYTNKEMYTIYQSYQSFEFETLAIRLNERYGYLDSIKNSPFRPGQYVKTVSVSNFNAPEHLLAINAATDPLYQLIRHTPNAKEVSADSLPNTKEWAYLQVALSENVNWKLHSLPALDGDLINAPIYFNCAYHVKDSLTTLNLTREMITRCDFGRLSEFKQLKELRVGKRVLKDLYDFGKLLEYLPQLKTLKVGVFHINDSLDSYNPHQEGTCNNSSSHHHLKKCSFTTISLQGIMICCLLWIITLLG